MKNTDITNERRREVENEQRRLIIKPISFEVFRKTDREKVITRNAVLRHRRLLRGSYGAAWRKYQNVIGS